MTDRPHYAYRVRFVLSTRATLWADGAQARAVTGRLRDAIEGAAGDGAAYWTVGYRRDQGLVITFDAVSPSSLEALIDATGSLDVLFRLQPELVELVQSNVTKTTVEPRRRSS